MVRAILDGRKTQTRRDGHGLASFTTRGEFVKMCRRDDGVWVAVFRDSIPDDPAPIEVRSPYGGPGDRLWVRETWAPAGYSVLPTLYRADGDEQPTLDGRWRPSIHMPRWASRITLEVTGVRVERLQAITEADAVAEGLENHGGGELADAWWPEHDGLAQAGATPREGFRVLWEAINGPGSWAANPWVWVVSFRKLA